MKSSIDWCDFYRNRTRNKNAQQAEKKAQKKANVTPRQKKSSNINFVLFIKKIMALDHTENYKKIVDAINQYGKPNAQVGNDSNDIGVCPYFESSFFSLTFACSFRTTVTFCTVIC
jgi:hypothetical protein